MYSADFLESRVFGSSGKAGRPRKAWIDASRSPFSQSASPVWSRILVVARRASTPGGAPGPAIQGQNLLERVEGLIAEHMGIVETAKSSGQLIAAIAALREIRANLELQGKLSGELANQNINFYAIDITESRIREFFDAAKLRAPQLGSFVRDQAIEQFGQELPKLQINFVSREQLRQQKVLEGSVTPSPSDAA
jgi:hypothetical protein